MPQRPLDDIAPRSNSQSSTSKTSTHNRDGFLDRDSFYEAMPTTLDQYYGLDEPEDIAETQPPNAPPSNTSDEARITAIITLAVVLILAIAMAFLLLRGLQAIESSASQALRLPLA